jgi:hypothetical protein
MTTTDEWRKDGQTKGGREVSTPAIIDMTAAEVGPRLPPRGDGQPTMDSLRPDDDATQAPGRRRCDLRGVTSWRYMAADETHRQASSQGRTVRVWRSHTHQSPVLRRIDADRARRRLGADRRRADK